MIGKRLTSKIGVFAEDFHFVRGLVSELTCSLSVMYEVALDCFRRPIIVLAETIATEKVRRARRRNPLSIKPYNIGFAIL